MKKFTSTWIIAVVVSLFVAFVYFYEYKGAEQRMEAELSGKRVFKALPEKVTRVVIKKGDNRFVLTQQLGQWQIIEPVADLADQDKLNDWTSQLVGESYQTAVTDAGQAFEPGVYGFDKPLGSIELELVGGGTQSVELGSRAAFGDAVYLKSSNYDYVVLGNRTWRDLLITRLFELRDKVVVRLPAAHFEELQVNIEGQAPFTFVSEKNVWTVREKPNWVLDQGRVKELISALTEMRAEDVIAEDRDAADAKKNYRGKNAPVKIIAALQAGDSREKWELEMTAVKDGKAYISTTSQKPVYVIKEADVAKISKTASYYRNRELPFVFDSAPVERLAVDAKGKKIDLLLKDGLWVLEGNDTDKVVDQGMVKDLLKKVRDLRVADFSSTRLKTPLPNHLYLRDSAGKELFQLSWSAGVTPSSKRKTKDTPQEGVYIAADTSLSDEVFLMDKSALEALPIQGLVKPKAPPSQEPKETTSSTKN